MTSLHAIHSDKSSLKELEMDCKDNDTEDSTAPNFKDTGVYVLPEYTDAAFGKVIQTHRDLFKNTHSITFLLMPPSTYVSTSLEDHAKPGQTMHRYSGYLPRRWKVFFVSDHLHYKNTISTLSTGKGARTAIQMHFHVFCTQSQL